ncbi:MAG: HDOD domain-containing protein [Enterobacterales bacterium]|nr:HDOD domain-containing protein [Enterobacterales bacterium]
MIAVDPGVAAAVIKIVNSPAFGLMNRISSIPQAVIMLGVDRVVSILKTLHVRKSFSELDTQLDMNLFWEFHFRSQRLLPPSADNLTLR